MRNMNRVVALVAALSFVAFPAACWATDPPQTFVVHVCSLQNRYAPLAGWQFEPADGTGIVNTCTPFGQFGMGSQDGRSVSWSKFMAPDVRVAALRTWRTGR